ncbi:MAG: pyridoxamine 5'-phosphate oxidase family protein [Desulfovibrio sp.]
MRGMSEEEMRELVRRAEWATICAVDPDGSPYAIEATPFFLGQDICFMINPRGGIYRCVTVNERVLVKFTLTVPGLEHWAGVSCMGRGGFDPDLAARSEGWRVLGERLNEDYSKAAQALNKPGRSPLFRVRVEAMTGRCSAKQGEPLSPGVLTMTVTEE